LSAREIKCGKFESQNILRFRITQRMAAKVFLSLSYVDRELVAAVRTRLPAGLSYFYEQSFENGEQLIAAMERATSDSNLFVIFASKGAAESRWVRFEIERARVEHIRKSSHRILIFPTSPDVRINDLPEWLRDFWMPRAGWAAADIARYITTIILEPDRGISGGVVRTIGRGKTLDELEQIAAAPLTRKHTPANV